MWTRGCAWRGHAPKKLAIRGHEEARGEATCLKLAQIQILLHLCASSRNTFFVRAIIVQGEFELNILAQVWLEAMCIIAVPKVSQADEHRVAPVSISQTCFRWAGNSNCDNDHRCALMFVASY